MKRTSHCNVLEQKAKVGRIHTNPERETRLLSWTRLSTFAFAIPLFVLLSSHGANLFADSKVHRIASAGMEIKLPSVFNVRSASFDVERLRLLDYQQYSLRLPAPTEDIKNLDEINALRINCPGDAYAVLFSSTERFPPFADYLQSIRAAAEAAQKKKGSRESDVQISDYSTIMDGARCEELSVRLAGHDNASKQEERADLFTEIAMLRRGDRMYCLIVRCYQSPAPFAQTSDRALFVELLRSIRIDELHQQTQERLCPDSSFSLRFPSYWTSLKYETVEMPLAGMPGAVLHELKEKGVDRSEGDSLWNAVAIQEPSFQLKVMSFSYPGFSKDSITKLLAVSLADHASNFEKGSTLQSDVVFGPNRGFQTLFTVSRRGAVLHRYYCIPYKGGCVIAHITCWQRDYGLVEQTVNSVLAGLSLHERSARQ